MDNFLYKMKLHEELNFNTFRILRVPGGWIYTLFVCDCYGIVTTNFGIFVPFHNEFQEIEN